MWLIPRLNNINISEFIWKELIYLTLQTLVIQAFEYKKLLLDYNREVRRATHVTMANLVTVVGLDFFLLLF